MSLKIIGTGKALPSKKITNDDLAAFINTSDEWIVSKTGIKDRYVLTDESLTDLAEAAGRAALEKAGLKAGQVDLVICPTISGDFTTPSLACCVLQRLGVSCPAFDVNAACAGAIYALDIAAAYLNTGKANNILIIAAEMMSKHVDWNDRNTCVLFGDGAGACIVTKGDALKYISLTASGDIKPLHLKTGSGNSPFKSAMNQEFLRMEGQEVFKFAVKSVEKEVNLALSAMNITARDIDYFILHQANKRIIDSVRTRLEQPEGKFPININKYGNMSAASILALLDEMLEDGKIKKGDMLLLSAFGAGMTTGTSVMIWE